MKVIIVGFGHIGMKEAQELDAHPNIVISGIVEVNPEKREIAEAQGHNVYQSLQVALERENPDLVRVATPPETHYELARKTLESHSDVYIEKIMTVDAGDARKLTKLADEVNKSIFVRRNAIYTPIFHRAWDKLESIGEVQNVTWIEATGDYNDWTSSKAEWLRDLPGGIISEHLPHALYLLRWYLQDEPSVSNVIYDEKELEVQLTADGKHASISYVESADIPMLLRIVGSNGVLEVDHSANLIQRPKGHLDEPVVWKRSLKSNLTRITDLTTNFAHLSKQFAYKKTGIGADQLYQHTDHYRQFTDIATGGTVSNRFQMDGNEGRKNVELFEEIWKSAGEI